jgi:hypothetical protein
MKIARIICWQLDSTLRPTMKRGFDIIPALLTGIDMSRALAKPCRRRSLRNKRNYSQFTP